jgi:hypothetical protein
VVIIHHGLMQDTSMATAVDRALWSFKVTYECIHDKRTNFYGRERTISKPWIPLRGIEEHREQETELVD